MGFGVEGLGLGYTLPLYSSTSKAWAADPQVGLYTLKNIPTHDPLELREMLTGNFGGQVL